MNILILSADTKQIESNSYPVCLTEIEGLPLLQHIVNSIMPLKPKNVIFAFHEFYINQFHLDIVAKQLINTASVISLDQPTQGAACTALLASEFIENNEPLLIISSNELVKMNLEIVIGEFIKKQYDAGAVIFQSVHPRYSFVRLDENDLIIEAAEKMPISNHATAGIYWYAKGIDFTQAVRSMIRKNARVNDMFFICPAFNEMVLKHSKIGSHKIDSKDYIQFKD